MEGMFFGLLLYAGTNVWGHVVSWTNPVCGGVLDKGAGGRAIHGMDTLARSPIAAQQRSSS